MSSRGGWADKGGKWKDGSVGECVGMVTKGEAWVGIVVATERCCSQVHERNGGENIKSQRKVEIAIGGGILRISVRQKFPLKV